MFRETERSLGLLKPRAEVAQKKETAEMVDKLKGLGNSILGMLARFTRHSGVWSDRWSQEILAYRQIISSLSPTDREVTRSTSLDESAADQQFPLPTSFR
jgi:hypothetical protein